jgi:hypothetical protein
MSQDTSTITTTGTGQQADDETTRIQSIEELRREQREQRGMLEQLLGRLGPGGKPASPGTETQAGSTPGLDIGAIQEQVRREITAADERREADKRERDWREEVTSVVEAIKTEKQPREQQTGVRAVLRRALIGRDG